jgi:hypothetical protein
MPSIIDPQTLYVDDLPAIWSPVQWELTEEERIPLIGPSSPLPAKLTLCLRDRMWH